MKRPIKIAIAEDHELFRQGLAALFNGEEGLHLEFAVANGQELIERLRSHKVDVVIMDLKMPVLNGQETLKILKKRYPSVRSIVLSMYSSDEYVYQALRLGARGFLQKNCDIEKLIDAIYAVNEQGYYFDDELSKNQIFRIINEVGIEPIFKNETLSHRELEVLGLICQEKTNQEIAELLCLSVRTIEVHRLKLLRKTNAKNVAGLVIYAVKNGHFKINMI